MAFTEVGFTADIIITQDLNIGVWR